MTVEQIKALEGRLWKAADELRANSKLTATEYSFPVLGIIFLRHANNRFVAAKAEIEKSLPVNPTCLLYTSPSPRDRTRSRMPSSA